VSFQHGTEIWSSDDWLTQATAWVDDRLAEAGLARTGDVEQPSLRPWATVLRVPSSGGTVWLKATGPEVAFEVGLYEQLQRVAPERVLTPLAVDVERGWVLLPDGGPSLGDRFGGSELVDALAATLPHYAQLQRDLAPHAHHLLALGVSDMRPEVMPSRFDEALDAVREYVEDRGSESERAGLERVAGMRATVIAWCERLAGSAVPPSLDHNDLHPWNILGGGEAVRFYDWGDGVVAHPFASMLALGWVPMDDTDLMRLRDAYLEPFRDLAPHTELVQALELACRVGKIARALTWHRAISAFGPGEVDEEWLTAPRESLFSLLEDSWLGRA
jgi:Phosphotransferase enzyme family